MNLRRKSILVIALVLIMVSSFAVYATDGYYTVQSGDMLWKIAEKYNITVDELVEINNLKDRNLILPGQKLLYEVQLEVVEEVVEEVVAPVEPIIPMPTKVYEVSEEDVTIYRDEMKIVGTLTMPVGLENAPAVIMFHGFTGQRHEMDLASGDESMFGKTARVLSEQGYATLRIYFIGSGESDGEWADTTVNGQVKDAEAALAYLQGLETIDKDRIAVLGLSQGGMVSALTASRNEEIKAAILWSAATVPQLEYANLLGMETVIGAVAKEDPQELVIATLPWGATTTLKAQFYKDVFAISPVAEITKFSGALQVTCGLEDTVIFPQPNAGQLYIDYHEGVEELIVLDYADHMLNIFTPAAKGLNVSIINAVDFLNENL